MRGWAITLLRSGDVEPSLLAELVRAFPGEVLSTPFHAEYPTAFNRRGLRRLYRLILKSIAESRFVDPEKGWGRRVVNWHARQHAGRRYDLVWGITTGTLNGPVAARNLGRFLKVPFIIEFHDPVPPPDRGPLNETQRRVFESCLGESSLVVTVTERFADNLIGRYPYLRRRVKTIHLTYDDRQTAPIPVTRCGTGQLVLLHAGSLSGGKGRNARSLVHGMAEAFRRRPELKGKLRVKLLGGGVGAEEAVALAESLGVPGAVEAASQVAPEQCLLEMDAADVLVVIKLADEKFDLQVPGKLFQYLDRGKPILGIMRDCEAAQILTRSGLGLVVKHSDVDGMATALTDLWNQRDGGVSRFQPDWEYIRSFSLTSMAEKLDTALRPLLPADANKVVR